MAPLTRREVLSAAGKTAAFALLASPVANAFGSEFAIQAQALPLAAAAGIDRVVMLAGKTNLVGWAGYGAPPRRGRGAGAAAPPPPSGPPPTTKWAKVSGPGNVTFADASAPATTATFSKTGEYVLSV